MKYFVAITLLLFVPACTPKNAEEQVDNQDSIPPDTVQVTVSDTSEYYDDAGTLEDEDVYEQQVAIDTAAAERLITSLINQYGDQADNYLVLSVEEVGREENRFSAWMFNTSCSLLYFNENWSSKEAVGTRHCFFKNEKLVGFREEESYAEGGDVYQVAFVDLPGGSYTRELADTTVHVDPITNDVIAARTAEFKSRLDLLVDLIKKGKNLSTEPGEVIIGDEREYDTEAGNMRMTTRVVLPQKLFAKLTK